MLVSVGIPVYNRLDSLKRSLNSIINQTYKNIEIIVSNDHSPNHEIDLLIKEYALKDNRIKYYYQEKSLRTVGNFSFVKDNANGKYFLWLADDDWIDNNYIEECVSFLENNLNYTIACGKCYYHKTEYVILHENSNYSIENNNYWLRIANYFSKVTLNGYFYGVMRTKEIKDFKFQNELGFDWTIVSYLCFVGKIKTLDNTVSHISKGGMSNEGSNLNLYFAKKNFITQYLVGFSTSLNCSTNVFSSSKYNIPFIKKIALSILIFICAYFNTFSWDLILLKRKIVKQLKINKNGILFKQK